MKPRTDIAYSDKRRARNREAKRCINDNKQGTHGPATHGVRCERCYRVHRDGARVASEAPFCAVCAKEQPPFVRRPLGPDNALVAVCARCDTEHPIHGGYSFEGGRSESGGAVATGNTFADGDGNRHINAHRRPNR